MSRTWRNWYQNDVDEEMKGIDSRDKVKHRKEQSVIFREDDVDGRARVTADEEPASTARTLNNDSDELGYEGMEVGTKRDEHNCIRCVPLF